jgi:quercetin dioxygenase-like cupin family protein
VPVPPRVTHIDDLPEVADPVRWHPVRAELGVSAFGVNGFAGDAGQQLIEEHDELGGGAGRHEELYVVVRGRARFTVDGSTWDAPPGTVVFVPDPASRRVAHAEEDGTLLLVVGGRAGEAFEPSAWETSSLAAAFMRRGDTVRGRRYMEHALAHHPEHLHVLYNVACAEALVGERAEALSHLRRAVELEPRAAEWAQTDADLDSIRDDPAFPAAP